MDSKTLKQFINADLYRCNGSTSTSNFFKQLLLNPGYRYMYIFRKCQYYRGKKHLVISYIFARYLLMKYMVKYGYEILYPTKIGKGFYIGHLGGIAVNPNTIIGENVNISKGVTIGQSNRGKTMGTPTIGNNVWIGANSIIVGKINIGNNVLIAPGAYVNFDVPDNSLVMGNPAEIINSNNATEGYINNKVS
jgi:serine O-acetyltransferase